MARKASKRLGVYCLEGRWAESMLKRDHASIKGLLEYLQKDGLIEFQRHRTTSPKTLKTRMAEWQLHHPTYELGYFAGHGTSHGLLLPGGGSRLRRPVYLDEVAGALLGRCEGRAVFFATCVTARNTAQMTEFLRTTRAIAVCGYRKSVLKAEAFAADTLIIEALARHRGENRQIRPLRAFRDLEKNHPWIKDRLGFVYFTSQLEEDSAESTRWVHDPS